MRNWCQRCASYSYKMSIKQNRHGHQQTYRIHQGNDPQNQLTAQEPTSSNESNLLCQQRTQKSETGRSYPARHIHPASNPRQNRHPSLPGDFQPLALPVTAIVQDNSLTKTRRNISITLFHVHEDRKKLTCNPMILSTSPRCRQQSES